MDKKKIQIEVYQVGRESFDGRALSLVVGNPDAAYRIAGPEHLGRRVTPVATFVVDADELIEKVKEYAE